MNKEDKPKKHQSTVDKIIMGAIIGTAVGSAIGASVAPKKGSETREKLKEVAKEAGDLTRETGLGFFRLAKRLLMGKSEPSDSDH